MARKLNDEISAEELQELDALLRDHPEEHYAVEIVSEQWKQSPPQNSLPLQENFKKVWESRHAGGGSSCSEGIRYFLVGVERHVDGVGEADAVETCSCNPGGYGV